MPRSTRPLALLMVTVGFGFAAEPQPTLDPVPPAVRTAAIKMARGGTLDVFDIIHERRTLYQVRLVDSATNKPGLATFAEDGSLVSIAEIPSREPTALPEQPSGLIATPPVLPVPAVTDPGQPQRADGRDAAPTTRRGIEDPKK